MFSGARFVRFDTGSPQSLCGAGFCKNAGGRFAISMAAPEEIAYNNG